jgi:hypothetical protein
MIDQEIKTYLLNLNRLSFKMEVDGFSCSSDVAGGMMD